MRLPHALISNRPRLSLILGVGAIAAVTAVGMLGTTRVASAEVAPTVLAAAPGPTVSIDARPRRPISPYIYGMSWADPALAEELHLPLNRWGGNHTSRYHWRLDMHNQGADWYFENVPAEQLHPGSNDPHALPDSSSVNRFIERNRRQGTATLLTVPMSGWVAARRPESGQHPYDCGFRQSRYGNQTGADTWDTDCGNGVRADGRLITGQRAEDTSLAVGPEFVTDWLRYLQGRYGDAARGGVRFIGLDNEPELWSRNHRDVRPEPLGYDELRDRSVRHADAVKNADAAALTLGPSVAGWNGYFWSDLDTRTDQFWLKPPDRLAHGDVPLVPWYLQQMRRAHERGGRRLLDYLDLHFYPQAEGVYRSPRTDPASQALRLRQTRALWDPHYVDESWIGQPVRLLPRMREWVDRHYPGTRLALSEYNFGALDHINGALTQAEVLGILGREGVDLAALWEPPGPQDPGAFAFRMYLNADGQGARFGSVSVNALSSQDEQVSVYGARDGNDGPLTLVLINKSDRALAVPLHLSHFNPRPGSRWWRYAAQEPGRIIDLGSPTLGASGSLLTLAAQSIHLLHVPGR